MTDAMTTIDWEAYEARGRAFWWAPIQDMPTFNPRVVPAPKGATARRATSAEQWRYGVELRIVGSRWRPQKPAPHHPAPKPCTGPYSSPAHVAWKVAHTRALGAPQRFSLTGELVGTLPYGWDAAKVVETRYLAWLKARP